MINGAWLRWEPCSNSEQVSLDCTVHTTASHHMLRDSVTCFVYYRQPPLHHQRSLITWSISIITTEVRGGRTTILHGITAGRSLCRYCLLYICHLLVYYLIVPPPYYAPPATVSQPGRSISLLWSTLVLLASYWSRQYYCRSTRGSGGSYALPTSSNKAPAVAAAPPSSSRQQW